ncbi:S-type pyocin domain-containing protein [Pseudomonas granadensis]|uniref:S-type pyocin domain-containing protein n=1 Tax=Pseudomonas granadensis TaxID=1421430 RepID=UPI001E571DBA|nr:S-type pyocin domain-containing protein [Pseudomonas granadensis]
MITLFKKDVNMAKPPTWEWTVDEGIHIRGVAPDNVPVLIPSGSSRIPSGSGMFGPNQNILMTGQAIQSNIQVLENEYKIRTNQLPQTIEQELTTLRREGVNHYLPPTQAVIRELEVRDRLIARKTAELQQKTVLANQFFGSDPANKTLLQFYQRASLIEPLVKPYGVAMHAWTESYRAAHEVRLLSQAIDILSVQKTNYYTWLAASQANDRELARQTAERTRIAAEQHRQQALAEKARREREEARVREQQRLAALVEKHRQEAEHARLAAEKAGIEAEARERERARIEALKVTLAEAEAQEKERLAALENALTQAQAAAEAAEQDRLQAERQQRGEEPHPSEFQRVYPASGAVASASPAFSFASTAIVLAPSTSSAILAALRAALPTLTAAGAGLITPALIGFAAMLAPSRLGNGERFSVSVPLAELSAQSPQTLRELADRRGMLNLPVGLGVRPLGEVAEVFVATTDDFHIRSDVPVLQATYDLLNDVYETALPDSPTDFLTWTPAISPGKTSTESPAVNIEPPDYSGATIVAVAGRLDLNPVLVEGWDRFIIVFPADSGIAPLYVVISSPYAGGYVKGKYSGRTYNPEQAGGPILDLDWRTAVITQAGIIAVKLHVARLNQSDANDIMIQRLEKIFKNDLNLTDTDLRYYTHELRELERYRNFGYSDNTSPGNESPIWNNAHTATLEDYKLGSELSLLYNEQAINAMDAQDQREHEIEMRNFTQ